MVRMDSADIIYRHKGHSASVVADAYGTVGSVGAAHPISYRFLYSFEEGLPLNCDRTESMARMI